MEVQRDVPGLLYASNIKTLGVGWGERERDDLVTMNGTFKHVGGWG